MAPTLEGKVALVTGASSGIGTAIARELAGSGARLMLVARREERLRDLAGELGKGEVAYHVADVADAESLREAAEAAIERFGRIDVLVNNAGVQPIGELAALDIEGWNRTVDVNLKGVLHGIAAVLPHMVGRGEGHVVNVGSVGSLVVTPGTVVYCATKHAVRAVSEGLRKEQNGRIRVTEVNPGAVESELLGASNPDEVARQTAGSFATWIPASSIASAVRYALEQPREVAVNEITIRPYDQEV